MASVSHRSTLALAICCGVLLASQALFVTIPASGASGSSTCSELRRWAQSYRGSSPTLEQLARYDRPHRIAIFNTSQPTTSPKVEGFACDTNVDGCFPKAEVLQSPVAICIASPSAF